jgi:hypothetical protein
MDACGRFAARPMAVRVAPAFKPCRPSEVICIEGIASARRSEATLARAARRKAKRPSLTMCGPSTLVREMLTP